MDWSKLFSQEAITYLAKQSPYAIFCILILLIINNNSNKLNKQVSENFEKTLKEIRINYDKNLEFFKEMYKIKNNRNRRS